MVDIWYTTGLAVMRPKLLDAVMAANPAFDFVQRIILEQAPGGDLALRPRAIQAGLLRKDETTSVRLALSKFAKNYSKSAPPISIYCAGRFCQYVAIPFFSSTLPNSSKFSDIVKIANTGYTKAVAQGVEGVSPSFPALLGACLMDGAITSGLKNPTQAGTDAIGEFGIEPQSEDWKLAAAFVSTAEFDQAAFLLMVADEDPWQCVTGEQMFFWEGRNEHAIP
jgi:hypothetical protein